MALEQKERKHWVDALRGFCMVAILLDHTEIYFTGTNIIDYRHYVSNVLVVFFFLSGYLFYRDEPFSLRKKLVSIVRSLLVPYFIFTTIIAIPKALVHGMDIGTTLLTVVTGQASWFVAALIVAEIVFSTVLWVFKGKSLSLLTLALVGATSCYFLSTHYDNLYWQIENAAMAIVILYLGYTYHKYETVINHFHTLSSLFFFFILFLIIKVYEDAYNFKMVVEPIMIDNWYVFIFDALVGTLFFVSLAKQVGSVTWLEWTGRRSLVIYFLAGGIPLITAMLLHHFHFNYTGHYQQVMFAFLLVYAFSSLAAWVVFHYFPFMVGKRKK